MSLLADIPAHRSSPLSRISDLVRKFVPMGLQHRRLARDLERLGTVSPHLLEDVGFVVDEAAGTDRVTLMRRGPLCVILDGGCATVARG